jgi:hypothetical protein
LENISDKCKATQIREEILEGSSPCDLSNEEWKERIRSVMALRRGGEIELSSAIYDFENYFLHFVMNPIGKPRENEIRRLLGLPSIQ